MRLDPAGVARLADRHRGVAATLDGCAARLRRPSGDPMLDHRLAQLAARMSECGAGLASLAAAMTAHSADLTDADARGRR